MRVMNMQDPEAKRLLAEGRAEYIGRGPGKCTILDTRPGQKGWLGNPHTVGDRCPICKSMVHFQGGAADAYASTLLNKYFNDGEFAAAFRHMMQDMEALVCWCAPKRCHGDVIIEVWEHLQKEAEL